MNIHKETGVRQYTCCPGGKRTSAKETVHIKGTDRTIEHTWRPHPRGVQVTSTLIKKNGQKGQVKVKVVADELETVTDVCRAHIEDIAKACKRAPLPLQQPKKETRAIVRQREACEAASRRRDGVGRREVRANPISEAISSSSRRRGGRASLQQPQEETPRVGGKMHIHELRQALEKDPDLLHELGLMWKEDAEVHKANSRELNNMVI